MDPSLQFLWAKFDVSSINSNGSPPPERGHQIMERWENQPYFSFKRQYLENASRYDQSYYQWL